jgi:electron transfer flavoprotein beta subunit
MKIFVCIKQVPDTEAVLSIKDGKSINEDNIKWIISPYDEYAIEQALKLKEQLGEGSVTAITVGPERATSALRTALAMGAEHAIHVKTDGVFDHGVVASALAGAIKDEGDFGIIFMGKQAIDDDAYVTHAYLAEKLGVPVATNVIAFKYEDKVVVEREIDEGAREKIEMATPCIVGATKGLNEPRYASLMGIMKAKKIPIKEITMADLGLAEAKNVVEAEKLFSLPEKPAGRVIEGEVEEAVKELVRLLKDEAKVL